MVCSYTELVEPQVAMIVVSSPLLIEDMEMIHDYVPVDPHMINGVSLSI